MKLGHTMLRTGSPDEMIEFYETAFNMELKRKSVNDSFTLYFLGYPNQTAELELTYNHGQDKKYEKAEGFGHIAIHTPENMTLQDAYDKAAEAGGTDYRPPEECPGNYAFIKDPEGYEVEILQKSS